MGFELELFVHPERISPQLICAICQGVLDRPVETPTEHLFCEDDLLEWMSRSNLCPVTKKVLDPSSIRKPGRIILNMLGELERYCVYKGNGCNWQGPNHMALSHERNCCHRPMEEILKELSSKDEEIRHLKSRLKILEDSNADFQVSNMLLNEKVGILEKKLKVYDAFFKEEDSRNLQNRETDLQRIARLRQFRSIVEGHEPNPR